MNYTNTALDKYGYGNMLSLEIYYGFGRIASFNLDNGGNLLELFFPRPPQLYNVDVNYISRPWNSLELAILLHLVSTEYYQKVYETVENKNLKLYSRYGSNVLHHIKCLKGFWCLFHQTKALE